MTKTASNFTAIQIKYPNLDKDFILSFFKVFYVFLRFLMCLFRFFFRRATTNHRYTLLSIICQSHLFELVFKVLKNFQGFLT